jgi:hypothetical protein
MLIHLKASTTVHENRDNRRRPIFWQRGSARSKRYGAMRKSRQTRCTAAILGIVAPDSAKLLDVVRNFGQAIFAPGAWPFVSDRKTRPDDPKLSKVCLVREPSKQASPSMRCLIIHL